MAEADGSFHARGSRHHSSWHMETVRDGGVSLKAHNVSWYLGISMFGHAEAVEHHRHDRCHFRVELDVDQGLVGGGVAFAGFAQPVGGPAAVVVAQGGPPPPPPAYVAAPPPVVVMASAPPLVSAPLMEHETKVAFFNFAHKHYVCAEPDGELGARRMWGGCWKRVWTGLCISCLLKHEHY